MFRSLLMTLLTIFVLNGIAALFVDLIDQIQYQPKIKKWQDQQLRRVASLKKEDLFYQNHSLFERDTDHSSDFNPFFISSVKQSLPLLSSQEREKIISLGPKWLEKKVLLNDIQPINSFFLKSMDFNFWTIKDSEFKDPHFNAIDWVVMGQALMNHARWSGPSDIHNTTKPIRHFAKLLLSTELLELNRSGISLLEKEIDFTNGRLIQASEINKIHHPLKKDDLNRIRKYYDKLSSLINPLSSPESFQFLIEHPSLPVGFCSVFNKKRDFFSWGSPYLNPTFLFESSYEQQFKLWNEVKMKAQKHCNNYENDSPINNKSWIRFLPFYRRIYAQGRLLKQEGLVL